MVLNRLIRSSVLVDCSDIDGAEALACKYTPADKRCCAVFAEGSCVFRF